jgi:hypothetical protein
MKIADIYETYKIPPHLQVHMLTVAGVARLIVENMDVAVLDENIVQACLLHDMGNIIKFNMNLFPEKFEPLGVEYWKGVREEFIKKYGNDEHVATERIAREIGVNDVTFGLIKAIGFSNAVKNLQSNDLNRMICGYADMRVSPQGVVEFELNKGKQKDADIFTEMVEALQEMERVIFAKCRIGPEDISDVEVNDMRSYEIV